MKNLTVRQQRLLDSALASEGAFSSTLENRSWLSERDQPNPFRVERLPFAALTQWSFEPESGDLVHRSGRFFRVHGVRVRTTLGPLAEWDQPIIDQPEIGILGIVAKEFDGI